MLNTASRLPIRVMIADDHSLLREGVATVLARSTGIELVAQADNGQEAVEQFIRLRPDVTLMDLQMPLLDGCEAMMAIHAIQCSARVIVLTTYGGDAQIGRALRAGAAGYLLKGALRLNLIEAIEAVHAGKRYIPVEVAMALQDYSPCDCLTGRELEVLRLVAQGHSNREAGLQLAIKEETVKSHVSAAMSKLGAKDRTHAVTIALKRGILQI